MAPIEPRLGIANVLRVLAASLLATSAELVDNDLLHRAGWPYVAVLLIMFALVVGCVILVIDEAVVRVHRAIEVAQRRGGQGS